MNNPKSNSLFHFTKSSDILKSILKNGIYPRFCLEDAEWYVNRSEEHAAGAMSCFCDIPLSRITEHTNFYGQYGVGLTKQWGVKNGLNPVIYFPKKGIVPNIANYLIELARENDNLLYNKEYINQLTRFVRIIKPMSGKMVVDSKTFEKDFYQENEWRYTPEIDVVIPLSQFQETYELENIRAESFKLDISPNDIKYIFVKEDADIPDLFDFIKSNLSNYGEKDIKILLSRIVSLETIKLDL